MQEKNKRCKYNYKIAILLMTFNKLFLSVSFLILVLRNLNNELHYEKCHEKFPTMKLTLGVVSHFKLQLSIFAARELYIRKYIVIINVYSYVET